MARPVSGGRGFEPTTSLERTLDTVVHNPSVWGHEVSRLMGEPNAQVHNNLQYLVKHGHVVALGTDWQTHYFAQYTEWEQRFLAAVTDDHAWALLQHAAARPGLDNQEEISEKAGIPQKALRQAADTLVDLSVLARVKIPVPGQGRPGTGYEVRWRDLAVPLGLLAVKLPPEAPQLARLVAFLAFRP